MTKLLIVGYGRMGKMIEEQAAALGACVVGRVDPLLPAWDASQAPDAILDFSTPEGLPASVSLALRYNAALVVGTTGLTDAHRAQLQKASESVPVICSSNYSLGVAVLKRAVRLAARALGADFDIEIVETHHSNKVDAPSGTALMLAEAANADGDRPYVYGRQGNTGKRKNEIGIHALRGGTVAGEHRVLFYGTDEVVELRHEALSRRIFATGAVKAALKLAGGAPGLYTMDDVISV